MSRYKSRHTGATIDDAIDRAKAGGAIDTALQKKAPAGYGLGETPNYIADANDAIKNGWYAISSNTLNLPEPTTGLWNYTYLKVDVGNRPDSYIKQTITSPYQHWHQCEVTRCFYDARGGWQPWEWVNPPMLLGVEYRTTERYLGKPVYVKVIQAGFNPAGTNKTTSDKTVSTSGLVRFSAVSGGWQFPSLMFGGNYDDNGNIQVVVQTDSTGIYVTTLSKTRDMTSVTVNVSVYYTKD